ncbi:chromate transporter [Ancylobacter sp. 6x-1]|uniref:Chromate transporter n=1 Tax=Ancylobacter crimeensis TaxID=2579147 RepID=A0ABT0DAK1_9HYPH|nr:chromate transporter [Ancylobacter crimeensis]MCK0196924.1 chromate transporter [Ancylobacter crimeensis]
MKVDPIPALVAHFLMISLFAVGGANAVLPEMHRQVVGAGWMSDAQFAQAFAIAQASPGPNVLVVTLIGWHVAGLAGALATTLAMCGPTCLLAYAVGGAWHRFRAARWRRALQAGLVPMTIGLIAASGTLLAEGAARSYGAVALTLVSALVLFFTRLSPIWMLALGAAAGALHLI